MEFIQENKMRNRRQNTGPADMSLETEAASVTTGTKNKKGNCSNPTFESGTKKTWQKILYEKQGYPDNYVDSSFLKELRKNLHVKTYDYTSLVCESCSITQQISSVAMFVVMYFHMEEQRLSPQSLWIITSLITALGYVVNLALTTRQEGLHVLLRQDLKTCVLFQGFSAALSPVLVSLTETISTDTIYAMTVVMLLGNVVFFNYDTSDEEVPGALSLNAAIFASVCLASRLHTSWHAFTMVTASFELFALWPALRRNLKLRHAKGHSVLTLAVTLSCLACLLTVSVVGTVLYSVVVAFITFACPAWFIRLQPLKNNIYGPWDEAVIKLDS